MFALIRCRCPSFKKYCFIPIVRLDKLPLFIKVIALVFQNGLFLNVITQHRREHDVPLINSARSKSYAFMGAAGRGSWLCNSTMNHDRLTETQVSCSSKGTFLYSFIPAH